MVVIFTLIKNTPRYVLYKSDNFKEVGDFSKIYLRNGSELTEVDELVLIGKDEYEFLKENLSSAVRPWRDDDE